jgi:hypothetical protein
VEHIQQLTKKHPLVMQQSTVAKQENTPIVQCRKTLLNHLTMIPERLLNVANLGHRDEGSELMIDFLFVEFSLYAILALFRRMSSLHLRV